MSGLPPGPVRRGRGRRALLAGRGVVPANDLLGDAAVSRRPLAPDARWPARAAELGDEDADVDDRRGLVQQACEVEEAGPGRTAELLVSQGAPPFPEETRELPPTRTAP